MADHVIPLDLSHAAVGRAREAERRLFEKIRLGVNEHDVDVDGLRVRALEAGHGHPLVILPGGIGDAWAYGSLIKRLSEWRVIAVNRPGGGLSDGVDHRAIDLRELAMKTIDGIYDRFGLKRATIAANGMGGLWAFWYAIEHPDRVDSITQFGCPALILDTSAPFPMRLLSVPVLNRLLIDQMVPSNLESARQIPVFLGHAATTWTDDEAACAFAFTHLPTYKPSWLSLMQTALTLTGSSKKYRIGPEELRHVRAPVQYVWGDADTFGGLETAGKAVVMVPSAILHETDGGHLPWLDDPAQSAAWVDAFSRDVLAEKG